MAPHHDDDVAEVLSSQQRELMRGDDNIGLDVPTLSREGRAVQGANYSSATSLQSGYESKAYTDGEKGGSAAGDVGEEAASLGLDQCEAMFQELLDEHALDPNFPQELIVRCRDALLKTLSLAEAQRLVQDIYDNKELMDESPYIEVRAVVPNTDDPTLPVGTVRAWVIGMILVTLGTAINTFFTARWPTITLTTYAAQVLAYPMAKFCEKVLPAGILNPGPFNQKEHMFITIMANVTFGGAYVTDIIVVQKLPMFFNDPTATNAGYQILLTISTQMMGYAVAGLSRRFLVYPPDAIWYPNLAQIALNKSFHSEVNMPANGWRISRLRWFAFLSIGYGLYFLLPGSAFQALSVFNWTTWIAPNNVKLALITGTNGGLGFNPWPTFDWNWFSQLNDPLISPLFSTLNQFVGMVIVGVFFIIPVYFTNAASTAYLPINSNGVFDRFGGSYNVSLIMGPDGQLDEAAYQAYSPPYLSAGNAVLYGVFFAFYTAGIVHAALYHHRPIVKGFKSILARGNPRDAYNDVHNRLMRQYPEVPEWWFGLIFLICFVLSIVICVGYPTHMPVWGIILSVFMGLFFLIPAGIISAVTNVVITLNVISELIAGFALVGRPLANMIFKSYGLMVLLQGMTYAQDMKLGHYMKIPPRTLFWGQTVATLWGVFVALGVVDWQMGNVENFCAADNAQSFSCPGYNTFFTAAVVWGAVGPARLFGGAGQYSVLMWGFLIGAILPIPAYFLARRYPTSMIKYVSVPALLNGGLNWAPYNLSFILPGVYVACIFNGYIKRRYPDWWAKYNYITATALSTGIAFSGIFIFLAFQYKPVEPSWWGNNISYEGCDYEECSLLTPPEEGFGPSVWS